MTLHIEPHEIARMLGGEPTLHRRVRSAAELRETVMSGLPRTALDRVVRRAAGEGIAAMELELAIVPRSTVRRRRGWLCIEESLRLERLARLTVLAEKVWGDDPVRVHRFLTSPHLELGGERPFDLIRSEADVRRVVRLLATVPNVNLARYAPTRTQDQGWTARATHLRFPDPDASCVIYMGEVEPFRTLTGIEPPEEGQPFCDPDY